MDSRMLRTRRGAGTSARARDAARVLQGAQFDPLLLIGDPLDERLAAAALLGHRLAEAGAVVLTGGSAYGLAAADGVMRYLEERGRGVAMGRPDRVVPIVPAAVIFDLPLGAWASRPDASFGYAAATAAASEFEQGSEGAGTGARAGVLKGGVGTASATATDGPAAGLTVGALVVAVVAVVAATLLCWASRIDLGRRPDDREQDRWKRGGTVEMQRGFHPTPDELWSVWPRSDHHENRAP